MTRDEMVRMASDRLLALLDEADSRGRDRLAEFAADELAQRARYEPTFAAGSRRSDHLIRGARWRADER